MKIGLVHTNNSSYDQSKIYRDAEMVNIHFKHVAKNIQWSDLFPLWIEESLPWDSQPCPEIPMPRFEEYDDLDVVVAKVPCGGGVEKRSFEDVFRLQINLVVANLLVRNGLKNNETVPQVYVVFIGNCSPMWELFRCDDLLWHEHNFWIYKPDLRRLKQKLLMPVGSCQLAPPFAKPGSSNQQNNILNKPKEAYVTVIHSSEDYVCGAIALAQSIIQSNSTKDLVLLADNSVSSKSLQGLIAAGWKIKHIERIRSPHAQPEAYNEWNYSKLRIWQLIEYDKVIFIDADLTVVRNIDEFFVYPQLSAVWNSRHIFNSGVMLIEPSKCTFETLMENRFEVKSYNGGDQGFLNEMFKWWHRWPIKINFLKDFTLIPDLIHEIPKDIYALHYLGLKPWMCYQDYDCNWDFIEYQRHASDSAHESWWKVYEVMPKKLKSYCSLSREMESRLRYARRVARNNSFPDGHWKIKVQDPRTHFLS
ncbi:putative UDP-glucuronate:xylan alpha-glucuronosyltransferase 4 [Forsythia ovata]|uniref:Hexosyltransferase n=1 Tax=Forsythia ovata TaxID=205694 RepID=A0ABD1PZ40_9LAMI